MCEPPGPCGAGRLRAVCGPDRSPAAPRPALVGRAAVCAGGRRPAREIATREPAARSGRSRGPPWPCRHPPAPSGALHTGGAWSLMCGSARRLVVRPGLATARWHRSQALPPPAGTAAGESRETVIAFAGVCSVSGETDDTIASQIPPFSAQFWRAKASWVSWRRPEVPALVLTVSSRGAVSGMGATKFAQRRLSMAIARKYSPSVGKMAQNGRFMACWASFFAEMAHMTSRWSSFCAHRHRN